MLVNSAVRTIFAAAALAGALSAQSVISARSGLIHHAEGQVLIGDKPVESKAGTFADVKDNDVLRTEEGRVEVLLTPGVFLRLGENSAVRMLSSKLASTRVEVLSGSVLLEVGELLEGNAITLVYKNQSLEFRKTGLYRIDAENGTFRVFEGEAMVVRDGATFAVKSGKMTDLTAPVMTANKFDTKITDSFHRWAARRAHYLSMANVAAAKEMRDYGSSYSSSRWAWNPWFGMFTFVPYRGYYYSPFGYSFWSPGRVDRFFYQPPVYGGGWNAGAGSRTGYDAGLGYNVGSRGAGMGSSGSYSGGGSSVSSSGGGAAAAPAPSARGGDSGGDRGSSTGGGRGR